MSDNQKDIGDAIKLVISELMDRVMDRVLITDPFVKEAHHAKKPLYAALVPDEIFKGSHFERRFVTPFGGVWEKLAKVVANRSSWQMNQYLLEATEPMRNLYLR